MGKKVAHWREASNEKFDEKLNEVIQEHENDGWELVETELADNYDPDTKKFFSTALLTFEK